MEEGFNKLSEMVKNLDHQQGREVVENTLKEIITTCQELLVINAEIPAVVAADTEVVKEAEIVEQTSIELGDCKLDFNKINVIDFVYKPIYKKDYYEGDYIIRFAEERTVDLKMADALDVHNKFWIQHKTVNGSIFGSVPMELLAQDAVGTLYNRGWIDTKVEIYEVLNSTSVKEITDICKAKFDKYILVREELTDAYLVLYYL